MSVFYRSRVRLISYTLALLAFCYSTQTLAVDAVLYEDTSPGLAAFRPTFNTSFEDYDPYTGKYRISHADVSITDSSGLNLNVMRTLNWSSDDHHTLIDDDRGEDIFGNGWMLSFGGLGQETSSNGIVRPYFYSAAGQVQQFYPPSIPNTDAEGVSTSLWIYKKHAVYSYEEENTTYTIYDYEVDSPNGRQYWFSAQYNQNGLPTNRPKKALLTKVTDASGAWYTISYGKITLRDGKDADNKQQNRGLTYIQKITHSNGTVLNFSYQKQSIGATLNQRDFYLLNKVTQSGRTLVSYQYARQDQVYRLTTVNYADGTHWSTDVDDQQYTSPLGTQTQYAEQKYSINRSRARRLSTKTQYVPGYGIITTQYDYDDNSSEVYAYQKGDGYCYADVYYSNTQSELYLAGTIKRKIIYGNTDCQSDKLRQIDYQYQTLKVSSANQYVYISTLSSPVNYSGNTYKPLTRQVKITDYKANGQDQYITAYSSFDAFGNPRVISERSCTYRGSSGGCNAQRITRRTYTNIYNASVWLIGLVKTETMDGIAGQKSYGYDGKGRLISQTVYGHTTRYTYNGIGQLTSVTDPLNHKFTAANYKLGIARTITGPENYKVTKEVDNYGNLTAFTRESAGDVDSIRTEYAYDEANRLTDIITPRTDDFDFSVIYRQYSSGLEVTTKRGADTLSYRQYDGLGRVIYDYQASAGNAIVKRYDELGRLAFKSYPTNSTLGDNYGYDVLGRLLSVTHSDDSVISNQYLAGHITKVTDEENATTQYSYESYGDPDEQYLKRIEPEYKGYGGTIHESEQVAITTINRNSLGIILSVAKSEQTFSPDGEIFDPELLSTQTYQYANDWQLSNYTVPEIGTVAVTYDGVGNLTSRRYPNSVATTYRYDGLNRLITENYGNGEVVNSFVYFSTGTLKSKGNAQSQWNYAYDANGNLTSETLAVLNHSRTSFDLNYDYDGWDHVSAIHYPNQLNYLIEADYAGRVSSATVDLDGSKQTSVIDVLKYDAYNRPSLIQYPHLDGYASYATDDRGRRTRAYVPGITDQRYKFYDNNNLMQVDDLLDTYKAKRLYYDQHGQLVDVKGPSWAQGHIGYDALGNISQKTTGGINLRYQYDASSHRLTKVTGDLPYAFRYDNVGNVTANGEATMSYDARQFMTELKTGGHTYTYEYDPNGKRVAESVDGVVKRYTVYNSQGQMVYEHRPANGGTAFFYLNGQKIASSHVCWSTDSNKNGYYDCEDANHLSGTAAAGSQVGSDRAPTAAIVNTWYHNDLLGSPIAASNDLGQIIWKEDYMPYGSKIENEDQSFKGNGNFQGYQLTNRIGYTGHEQDPDTGLTYMQARYYDPVLGRFYAVDPVGFVETNPLSFNRYAYANNNPYKYVDPDGRLSYLVSRHLNFTDKANHNFIVSHAKFVGDTDATVASFGDKGDHTMGHVNGDTKGFSEGTSDSDKAAWNGINNPGSTTTYRLIDASDEIVDDLVDRLIEGQHYFAIPEFQGGVNSNSAAGAIAHTADGGLGLVDNGFKQPGASSYIIEKIQFEEKPEVDEKKEKN